MHRPPVGTQDGYLLVFAWVLLGFGPAPEGTQTWTRCNAPVGTQTWESPARAAIISRRAGRGMLVIGWAVPRDVARNVPRTGFAVCSLFGGWLVGEGGVQGGRGEAVRQLLFSLAVQSDFGSSPVGVAKGKAHTHIPLSPIDTLSTRG